MLTEVLARSVDELRPLEATIAANAATGLRAFGQLARALAERVAPAEPLSPAFVAIVLLQAELCDYCLDGRLLSERTRAALAMSVGDDMELTLRLSLRQQLFGRELLLDEQLPAGLLRMAFVIAIALAGARLRAVVDGHSRVTLSHLSFSHMMAQRTLRRPAPHDLLRANGAQVWPILDALPSLFPISECWSVREPTSESVPFPLS